MRDYAFSNNAQLRRFAYVCTTFWHLAIMNALAYALFSQNTLVHLMQMVSKASTYLVSHLLKRHVVTEHGSEITGSSMPTVNKYEL